MKNQSALFLLLALLLTGRFQAPAQTNVPGKLRLVLVGDSTVNDAGGWGCGFKQFLADDVECFNTAANGRSSKSFLAEGRWQQALDLKGDYYLIQFGHNDEPGKGPERETDPATTFPQNLARYVDDTRAIGGKPVLLTPLTRRNFDRSGNGKLIPGLPAYVAAVKRVAAEKHVPVLDLYGDSVALCERIGPAATARFNPMKDGKPDTSHLNAEGRVVFARLVVAELRQAVPELAPHLLAEPNAAGLPKTYDVRQFGAVGDGRTLDTQAIQKALDACAQAGGGTVKFPPGTYLSQPIYLKGNGLTVLLAAGARLQATDKFADFAGASGFVNASGLNDLTLTGPGVIDGAGAPWWPGVKAAKKNGAAEPRRRPRLVLLEKCLGLRIEGITLQNSPSFHLVPVECEDVTVENVTIKAPADSPNTDANDPYSCRHVVYRHCTFDVGDDNIAIKTIATDGTRPAVEDILVEDCTFLAGHGISIGSQILGGVSNVFVHDCTFAGTTSGIRIKADRDRGAVVESCTYSNLTMKNVSMPINLSEYYPRIPATDTAQPVTSRTPVFRNVKIVNLTADSPVSAGFVVGLPESCISNVVFENVSITAPQGLTLRNTRAIAFTNSQIKVTEGKPLILETNAQYTFQ